MEGDAAGGAVCRNPSQSVGSLPPLPGPGPALPHGFSDRRQAFRGGTTPAGAAEGVVTGAAAGSALGAGQALAVGVGAGVAGGGGHQSGRGG